MAKEFEKIKIFTGQTMEVNLIRARLAEAGIETWLDFIPTVLTGGASATTSLWVFNEKDLNEARRIIGKYDASLREGEAGSSWKCPKCGEKLEAQFSACWQCGAGKPE